ncbi:MAG: serine hydrolase [Chlamydiota bacterium]
MDKRKFIIGFGVLLLMGNLKAAPNVVKSLSDEPVAVVAQIPIEEIETSHLKEDKLARVDELISKALERFRIPGVAVGIVIDGKVVLAKGYGLRDQSQELPVTENTLFAIGSCSKAFTTFALGQMVDDGIIAWNDPVIKYLPEFRLKDVYATHHLTIKDLVTHRSGLPDHTLVWYGSRFDRAELLSRLQYLELTSDLREKFQYNNLMYAVAGLLIERVTGQSWEATVQSRIFTPLEMAHSNFSVEDSQKSTDFSLPHTEKDEKSQAIPFRYLSNIGPAGSINSSVKDMTKWIRMQLSEGSLEGKHLINKETLKEMHTVQVSVPSYPDKEPYVFGYGLGWRTGLYKGHYGVSHGGGIDGFISSILIFPKEKTGIIVLTNSRSSPFFAGSIAYGIADLMMDLKEEDWLARIEEDGKAMKAALLGNVEVEIAASTPIRSLDDYIGEFENQGYGTIRISLDNANLVLTLNDISYSLNHKCYDHFIGLSKGIFDGKFGCFFTTNSSGEISEFHLSRDLSLPPASFKRKAENKLLTAEYLKRFIGKFENNNTFAVFSFRKDHLVVTLPGQPPYELVSEKEGLFSLKGLPGYTVRFVPDVNSRLEEVLFIQPNGTFSFKSCLAGD